MVEGALLSVVREALRLAAKEGMPGDHHFYLTFRTQMTGVALSDTLRERYPEEMTIVLQHQYWDLKVDDERFRVTLSFDNRPHDLVVPFAALTSFVDPAVKFGLQFNVTEEKTAATPDVAVAGQSATGEATPSGASAGGDKEGDAAAEADADQTADVVALDSFRKKS